MRYLFIGLVVSSGIFLAAWLRFGSDEGLALNPPTVFSDEQHGFSLAFPSSWFGVQSLKLTTDLYDYVAFTHPVRVGEAGREGKLEFSLFVMDRPEEEAPVGAVELAERNGRRYAWMLTNTKVPKELAPAAADLNGILSTFVTSGI